MKAIKWIYLFLFVISCSTPVKETPKEEIQKQIKTEKKEEMGEKDSKDIEKKGIKEQEISFMQKLIGEWEAEEMGDVLAQYGYSLPAKITFKKDGTYIWEYTRAGKLYVIYGIYKIVDEKSSPKKIDYIEESMKDPDTGQVVTVYRNRPVKKENLGIIDIMSNGKMKTIFYDKKLIPRPEVFSETDTQIYRKIK